MSSSRLTVNGRTHDVRATVTQALESGGLKDEAARIGAGAGVGAIIGGILGGVKGAIAGILIGGGGVVAATEGKDVELETGTVLRVRFDSNVPLVTDQDCSATAGVPDWDSGFTRSTSRWPHPSTTSSPDDCTTRS